MKSKPVHNYMAALYLRLSRDDGDGASESASITTQKKMLLTYAKEKNFSVHDIYCDDGYSGTNFERPDFKRMIADIENKKINLVITKDLSRLGRDYIKTGEYTEIFFPMHGIRYIAVNDGYDSESIQNDIAPFKNIVNEMYARDISKKIRSAFQTKMKAGEYIGNFSPYGYQKDPENKNHLVIDEGSASIVQKIFSMAENGQRPKEIAEYLNGQGILTPIMYRAKKYPYFNPDRYRKKEEWTSSKVSKILKNIIYLGHTAQGKTSRISFKNHKSIENDKEEWIIIYNTHEQIISQETFDKVSSYSGMRKNSQTGKLQNIFSGIAKCADCGRNMSSAGSRKKDVAANLVCGGYKLYGSKECTNHFIDYRTLYQLVLEDLNKQIVITREEAERIYSEVKSNIKRKEANLEAAKQKKRNHLMGRYKELDCIIKQLYEDNLSGKISDFRFVKLSQLYEQEQKAIHKKVSLLSGQERLTYKNSERLWERLNQYRKITYLDRSILYAFIDHIEINQGIWIQDEMGKRKIQEVKIYYKFRGNIE